MDLRKEYSSAVVGGATELDDLSDVDLTGLSDDDVLVYDLGTLLWKPEAPASGAAALKMSATSCDVCIILYLATLVNLSYSALKRGEFLIIENVL